MKCQYVCGVSKTAESGTAKATLQMKFCGRDTDIKILDVPICKPHSVYSKPMWEWTKEDYKLIEEVD